MTFPWHGSDRPAFPGVPAWGLSATQGSLPSFQVSPMAGVTPAWAWDDADGSAIRVCVLDTGVDPAHPAIGELERSVAVTRSGNGQAVIVDSADTDVVGHGTACAGVIKSIAPGSSLTSVRVLTSGKSGTADDLLAGLEWAIAEGYEVINLSLATTRAHFLAELRELADSAYFRRSVLVVSAHNMPVRSFPWTFSSVISVACHDEPDPAVHYYNPAPPVDFYARGVRVTVPWLGGATRVVTGNSFAAPHISGLAARILSKHRWLTPFQLKTVLYLTARNVDRNGVLDADQ